MDRAYMRAKAAAAHGGKTIYSPRFDGMNV
jgi:hypothetical protein